LCIASPKAVVSQIEIGVDTRDGRNATMTPAASIELFADLASMSIDQAIFSVPNGYDLEPFDLLATEIAPLVEKIQVAGRYC
jgi:hypothetical protein